MWMVIKMMILAVMTNFNILSMCCSSMGCF
jgi:hypothetical protein